MSFFINVLAIVNVPGVRHYMLVKTTGTIVSHNVASPEETSALLITAGNGCTDIHPSGQFGPFRYVTLNQADGPTIIVFGLGKYYLGVETDRAVNNADVVSSVRKFIAAIA